MPLPISAGMLAQRKARLRDGCVAKGPVIPGAAKRRTRNARFNATGKTYRYRISNTATLSPFDRLYTWHVHGALDVDRMNEAAQALVGRHDFAAFQSLSATPRTTERTVTASEVRRDGALVLYEVTGNGFLHHMVRAIAGTLVEVGKGKMSADDVCAAIASLLAAGADDGR